MKFEFDAVMVSVGVRTGRDGKSFYRVNVDQDGEIVTFDCREDVTKNVEKYKPYRFKGIYVKGEYDGRTYSRISIAAAVPLK